ncbi:sodium channel protein Nach isoform X2 [Leptinotarsa decemlineata]|uniref:sodium channel protein Nach isoform X2 n=1 Tax=Leptinotarsa decemlineata TaxID=7539 RepID=UPI003D308528
MQFVRGFFRMCVVVCPKWKVLRIIWGKVFWIIVVICGLCCATYMTVLFWERYISNPTRTTILTSYAPVTTIPFPAVTICNINRIMVSKVEKFMNNLTLNDTEEETIRSALPQLLAFNYPNNIHYNMTKLKILQDILVKNDINDMSFVMSEITQSCDEMLLSCSWEKKKVDCAEIFTKSLTADGYCCSFNSGNSSQIDDYTVLLNVFFLDQRQTVYLRDIITSTIYLLSSFGGVYSLFMGCSLITIFEILYYCIFRFVVNIKLIGKVESDFDKTTSNKSQNTQIIHF